MLAAIALRLCAMSLYSSFADLMCLLLLRQNQELEQESAAMHEQHLKLQLEAEGLAERLEVVLHDKFQQRHKAFDADTPIDKALSLLQGIVEACPFLSADPSCVLVYPFFCMFGVTPAYMPPCSPFSWTHLHLQSCCNNAITAAQCGG